MEPFLSIKGIAKNFGEIKVLENINLDIFQGEILALLGRSGCGKSTLIKILAGYYRANSGKISISKKYGVGDISELRQIVGYTTQDNSFYEKLTVYENMNYYANLYNVDKKIRGKRIADLLQAVNLERNKDILAGSISGGMKRRLDFALSLVHEPKVVILDEPTTGLDPSLVAKLWEIVKKTVKDHDIAVLVSSHILSEVKIHCTRAAFMAHGTITHVSNITEKMDIESDFKKYTL